MCLKKKLPSTLPRADRLATDSSYSAGQCDWPTAGTEKRGKAVIASMGLKSDVGRALEREIRKEGLGMLEAVVA